MRQQSGKRWEKVRMSEAGKTERLLPSSIGGSLVRQARLAGRKLGKGGRNGRGNICDKKGEAGKHGDAVFLRLSLIKNLSRLRAVIGVEADVFVAEVGGAQIVAAVAQTHMDLHRDVGGFEQL